MAIETHTLQLAVPADVDRQGKFRVALQVLNVVHDRGLAILAFSLADLTLKPVKPQYLHTHAIVRIAPFRPEVKLVFSAFLDESLKLFQSCW